MLFNSEIFLFAFLPLTFCGFYTLGAFSHQAARILVIGASFFFYAWWNPPYVLLLLASAALNFALGRALQNSLANGPAAHRKALLIAGICFNLLLLGYFKYF